ncbi:hypothetical protein HDU92_001718 [Lobulomyces angularis]|nr:hypothetical protein HDU92_001718 [Lobulomyces angularis]
MALKATLFSSLNNNSSTQIITTISVSPLYLTIGDAQLGTLIDVKDNCVITKNNFFTNVVNTTTTYLNSYIPLIDISAFPSNNENLYGVTKSIADEIKLKMSSNFTVTAAFKSLKEPIIKSFSLFQFVMIIAGILLCLALCSSFTLHFALFLRKRSFRRQQELHVPTQSSIPVVSKRKTLTSDVIEQFPKSLYTKTKLKSDKLEINYAKFENDAVLSTKAKTDTVINKVSTDESDLFGDKQNFNLPKFSSINLSDMYNKELTLRRKVVLGNSIEMKNIISTDPEESEKSQKNNPDETAIYIPSDFMAGSCNSVETILTIRSDCETLQDFSLETESKNKTSVEEGRDFQRRGTEDTITFETEGSNTSHVSLISFTSSKNELQETCVICIEEYEESDEIRTLPCKHFFHTHCIDEWLRTKSTQCPLCKSDFEV